jgi:Resolvase, N terminal domain
MKREGRKASLRCAIYIRVSTENGLEQEFNSLDNQREASEAYIRSQAHEGWKLIRDRYDDGGFSGDVGSSPTSACGANANEGGSRSQCRMAQPDRGPRLLDRGRRPRLVSPRLLYRSGSA